jgi:PAS domain S-box-containing protein
MLNRQLATSLASALLFEDEVRKSRHAAETAAQKQEQLSQQLELQTRRMRRMTELSPVGMYLFDPEGKLVEANDRYYEMTGAPREDTDPVAFLKICAEVSRPVAMGQWEELLRTRKRVVREIQLMVPKVQPPELGGDVIDSWVLAVSQPELGPDGEVVNIMGALSDISHMKWAQSLQETRLREAEETKRQQNEFLDMTRLVALLPPALSQLVVDNSSHEMRNPLSAISICAEDIRDTLTQHKFRAEDGQIIADCLEATQSISQCVQHQKSIVDDILTVSKLDSRLLLITPVPTQPVIVIKRAMNMFKPEVQSKNIEFIFVPHESLERLGVDWALLDPARLLQIMVNLITNAIKFTQGRPKRSVKVHVSASPDRPNLFDGGFQFAPTRGEPFDLTSGQDWGAGELLYLRVEVEDTGCGLTVEEKDRLFERFAQANQRTHTQYGGSGLGLFISRQLAELHGGRIGVASKAGVGSTFAFYLQCRRTSPESNPPEVLRAASGTFQEVVPAESSRELAASASTMDLPKSAPTIPQPAEAEKLHILVVEDNLVNQKVLQKQLTKAGYIISTADNGVLALQHLVTTRLHKFAPNGTPLSLILTDVEMPEMDGLTCCRKIREMEANGELTRRVPVIAVTANVRGGQIEKAMESGLDDVVGKPFKIPDLLKKIQTVLQKMEGSGPGA